MPDYAGVTYDRIDRIGLQTPVPDETHPGTPFLFDDVFPSGRGKFYPLDYFCAVEQPDDEYPFILTTGRVLEHWHGGTMTRRSQLDALYPEALAQIHPLDAEMLGIADGTAVCVASRRGEIILRAQVTEKSTVGLVFIPFHFAEAAANLLTIDTLDPQARIPEFKACAVQLCPARPDQLANPEVRLDRGRY